MDEKELNALRDKFGRAVGNFCVEHIGGQIISDCGISASKEVFSRLVNCMGPVFCRFVIGSGADEDQVIDNIRAAYRDHRQKMRDAE